MKPTRLAFLTLLVIFSASASAASAGAANIGKPGSKNYPEPQIKPNNIAKTNKAVPGPAKPKNNAHPDFDWKPKAQDKAPN
ncbi:MAG: hypothetical protein HY537_17765 [Deltaproteobacteria bacterium]|nr:hypothetical protein [Deltaproteobacteria bacterium]